MPRDNKMSPFSRLIIAAILLCVFFGNPHPLRASDYQQAYTAVENLAAEIRMSEGAVGQTLMEAMQAKHGEFDRWTALDQKMAALGRTIDKNLPEIGRNAAVLFAQNPDATLPGVSLGSTFEGNLKMATDRKKELLSLAKGEQVKLDKINQLIARTDKNILNAARGLAGETMESFLPDEIELAGEGAVLTLSLYFGPPGWIVGTIMAGTLAFNAMVDLYYNTQAATEQTKVLNSMKQVLLKRKAQLEQNIKTLMDGAQEMHQIEQVIEKHEKSMDGYKARVNAAVDGWNEQSRNAFADRKRKLEEEAEKMASQPKPEIKLGTWIYGMDPIPPLSAGEYGGEVDAMISRMESAARAVEDGGDPDNFQIMVTDWHNRLNERYTKVKEEYDQKYELYRQASETCWNKISAAQQEAGREWNALWNSCRVWDDRCRAAADAISARYRAAEKAAYDALRPFGQAMINPYREMAKLNQIHYRVSEVYYPCIQRINNATQARTREFWNAFRLWETRFTEANRKVAEAVSVVPYWIDQWKERAARLDEEIRNSLKWGGTIVDVRAELLATAEQLKDLDKTVKETARKYDELNNERLRIANQAETELKSISNRYGRLINYYWSSNFYINSLGSPTEFTPHAPEQEKNIAYLAELIPKTFSIYEPENLKNARKVDIPGIAGAYENKANELTFYTDWIDTYRHRLATAAGALNRISLAKTNQGFYAPRGGSAWEVLQKEFSAPPWSSIVQDVEKCVSREDYAKLPGALVQSWESLGVRQKLYAGQRSLLARLDREARWYIQVRSAGGFQPVNTTIMKPLQEGWKNLRQICERYDALAKTERERIGNGEEEAQKAGQPLLETFNKLPELSRNVIQNEHYRFSAAYNWLTSYLREKREALQATLQPPTNTVAVQLDMLFTDYDALYAKWQAEQEEAQRRLEEAQRRYEAEQKRIAEEARRKAEEERRLAEEKQKKEKENLMLVQDLYARFKNAYETKNDSQVMSLISDQWQAGDGSTLSDLQMNLRRSFKMFDEIRYNIQNLSISPHPAGYYTVSYDVTITSRIYRRNLKHEEKSSINEEVTINSSGKAKISRTLGGRFWYIQ